MLHRSRIYLVAQRQLKGEYVPFSLKFVKESGEIVEVESCVFQSEYMRNSTMDIKLPGGEIRTVRTSTIIEFNGEEVFV